VRKRILLSQMPQILFDVLENLLADCQDLEVFGRAGAQEPLAATVAATGADVLIMGELPAGNSAAPYDLLSRFPRLKILALVEDAREVHLYEWAPTRRDLGAISVHDLVAFVRQPDSRPHTGQR
jgi:DNA-binding NarL/FixJ family response regulator